MIHPGVSVSCPWRWYQGQVVPAHTGGMGVRNDESLTIDAYLDQLGRRLRGPREWRRRVLEETRDGLLCELDSGCSEPQAIDRWGPVGLVAADFNESGRVVRCRGVARMVLGWIPVLAVGWFLVVALSPDPWAGEPELIQWVAPALFASVAATVVGSLWLLRRTLGGRRPTDGVAAIATGVVLGVMCLCVLLAYRLDASHGHVFWPAVCLSGTLTVGLLTRLAYEMRHVFKKTGALVEG